MKLARMAVTMAAAAAVSSAATRADQFFSNLDQSIDAGFLEAGAPGEFGTTLQTGSQAVVVDSVTVEELSYDAQTAAALRIRILEKKVQGSSVVFQPVGELANPVASATDTGTPGTTYVGFTPSSTITLSANSEYLVAISATPPSDPLIALTSSGSFSSTANWQLGSDWFSFPGEPFESVNFTGHLKLALEGTVAPNQAPDVSQAFAANLVLWPANGNMFPVDVLGVTDPDGDEVEIVITAIQQDEPVTSSAPGDTGADAIIDAQGKAWVKAQRNGTGNGRVYTIHFTAKDGSGGSADGVVYVTVPHDKGKGAIAIDDGPVTGYYNSTQP